MKLLHIDSSILGGHSVSRTLSAAVVTRLAERHPGLTVVTRDLAAAPLSHLSGAALAGLSDAREPALVEDLSAGAAALQEFLDADIVVIGVPMYNFAIPSQLKSWIDRVLVAGKTFHYTEAGPQGLAGGKRVILLVSRGGLYGPGAPAAAYEHQESYLRVVFGFMGLPDIEVIRAEGLKMGDEVRDTAIRSGLEVAKAL